jgi:hypothetical protein
MLPLSALDTLKLLAWMRIRSWWNAGRFSSPLHRRVGSILTVGSLLLFGVILFAFHAFLVRTAQSAGPEASAALIERTVLFLFLFLLAGGVPFVSSTLLASGDLALLAAAPARPSAIATARLLDAVIVSSGQLVVIGIPLLVAAGWALNLSVLGWAVFTLETLLLLALPVFLVAFLLILLVRVLGARRVRTVVALTSAALSIALCLLMVRELSHGATTATGNASTTVAALRGNSTQAAAWMPSTWVSDSLLALGSKTPGRAFSPFVLLSGITIGLGVLCVALGGPVLVGERLLEGDNSGIVGTGKQSRLQAILRLFPLSPPARAILAKDIRYVVRDLVLLSQIGIPVILYFVPFVIGGQMGNSGKEEILVLMAGVIGTIVYMETSILSLSSVGLEGRAFWLILGAPVSSALFIRAKWCFALLTSLALCGPLVIIACWYYAAPVLWAVGGLLGLTVICFSLCGFGVGVAGLFPRFVYDNPAHRASLSALIWGFVGATTYLMVAGLLAAGTIIGAQQWPERSGLILAAGGSALFLFAMTTALVPLVAAERRLNGFVWEE